VDEKWKMQHVAMPFMLRSTSLGSI